MLENKERIIGLLQDKKSCEIYERAQVYDFYIFREHCLPFRANALRACCEIFLLPCVISDCLFRKRGFDIKWIDDTHALGLFSSPIAGK